MDRGYVQVYTGEGKGKTTAALGLALRALGAGLSVFFGQFMKSGDYSEILALEAIAASLPGPRPRLELRQFGLGRLVGREPSEEDREAARAGLALARERLASGAFDLAILDEINVALSLGLVAEAELLGLIASRPAGTELVLTGRGASRALIEAADLVTEMREVKHYYARGVQARRGIEL